jgi:hypothetical protein
VRLLALGEFERLSLPAMRRGRDAHRISTAALPLAAGTRRGGDDRRASGGHKRPQRGKRPSPPLTSWRGCAIKASAVWRPASLKGEGSDAPSEEPAEGWSPAAGVEVAASPELDEPPEPPELPAFTISRVGVC